MSYQKDTPKCTRERIVDALAPHLTPPEIPDMAGWLCGLEAGKASHLDALGLGGCQHAMGMIENARDVGLLVGRYRAARRLQRVSPVEGAAWLF